MKYLFNLLTFILFCNNLLGQEQTIKSKITTVTVFRSGAQIKRSAQTNIKSGQNEIVFTDLPAGFNENSINVKASNGLMINSVSYRNNFSKTFESNTEYVALKNQLDALVFKKENEQIIYDNWKEEESLLLSNKKVSGENSGLLSEQLIKTAEIFRTRLLEVKQNILNSRRKLTEMDKEINNVTSQINEYRNKFSNQNTGEVLVSINADRSNIENIELSYIDYRASWRTSFDLRLESLQKPLNLVNKGIITQFTGEDWKDVNLNLSTGNPNLNIQFPIISPWFLYYYQPQIQLMNDVMESKALSQSRNSRDDDGESGGYKPVESKENITTLEYTINGLTSIKSDNKEHEIKLNDNDIPAKYTYFAVPKLDKNVFLQANITDWENYNLSSGDVKLFFEGTYVGTSYLNADQVGDTLTLSLGPDIAITSLREKLKDQSRTSIFSSRKQLQAGYEITIKNNKPISVEIILKDQIPISTDSEMDIEVDELTGGKLNKELGLIQWNLTLKPGEQIKKRFGYTVKIPKDKKVNIY